MFETGTKIRLIASSCKKSTGPKRGSMGYVSREIESVVLTQLSLCASFFEIFFYRYGFEKRRRVEKKSVVLVFPIVSQEGKGDIHQQVKVVSDMVVGRCSDEWHNSLLSYFGATPETTIAIAAPAQVSECSLLDCSKSELSAWAESYLSSSNFVMFLQNASATGHYSNSNFPALKQPSTWDTLRHMSMDRSYKLARLDNWMLDKETRETAVRALRAISIMAGRQEFGHQVRNTTGNFMSMPLHKPIDPGRFYENMRHVLMRKAVIDKVADLAKSVESRHLLLYTEDLEAVRGELLVLSARLEKANNTAVQ